MTLLLVARAKDGVVALSDRKESVGEMEGNEVTKYRLGGGGSYYVAFSGDGAAAAYILNELGGSQAVGSDVLGELRRLAGLVERGHKQHDMVAGLLVVAEPGKVGIYAIHIADGAAEFYPVTNSSPAEGDVRAIAIFENLVKDVVLLDMPCELAVKYLHTLVSRIAETVSTVGRRDKYGIDAVVFTEAGGTRRLVRQKGAMGTLDMRFHPYGGGQPFDENGGDR